MRVLSIPAGDYYHVICPPESSIFSKEFFGGFSAAVVYSRIPARLLRVFALSAGQVNSENGYGKKDLCLRVALGQGSPTLLLESYRPADFSSNPAGTHLSVIIK